jgi:tetratricopeptide (TPR) repeat protein
MSDLTVLADSATFWTEICACVAIPGAILALVTLAKMGAVALPRRKVVVAEGSAQAKPKAFLPAPSHFVNRDSEMSHAMAQIREGAAVLAIDGATGVGKSATATQLAHRLRDPLDGIVELRDHTFLWIDCKYGSPNLVDICGPLSLLTGDQSLSIVAGSRKLDALRVHLATHDTVLVLDNLTLADDERSDEMRELLRAVPTGSLVIASVNRPCALEAASVSLPELKVRDVLKLIEYEVDALNLHGAGNFDETFASRLCKAVGGNPEMIHWFMQKLSSSAMSLDECLSEIELGNAVPEPEKYATRWQALAGNSRQVLSACAYLLGEATAEQLMIACDLPEQAVTSALQELIWAGLIATVWVTDRPSVYTCAVGIRRFVRDETQSPTVEAFTLRLVTQFVRFFTEAPEDAGRAIPHVGAVHAVLDALSAAGNDADLQSLFRATLDIFFTLGLFDDRLAAGVLAFESASRAGNHSGASLAAEVLSSTYAVRGELSEASEALALGLEAAGAAGTPVEEARQMRCSGLVSYRSGRPDEALALTERAEILAGTNGELEILINILDLRIAAHWYRGSLEDSEAEAFKCLQVCDQMPWERAKAYSIRHLAEVSIHRGKFREAQTQLETALRIAVEHEDQRGTARIGVTQARLHLMTGDLSAAVRVAVDAEGGAQALGLRDEEREARALKVAARRARVFPPLRLYYALRRPARLTDAPIGGD